VLHPTHSVWEQTELLPVIGDKALGWLQVYGDVGISCRLPAHASPSHTSSSCYSALDVMHMGSDAQCVDVSLLGYCGLLAT